MGLQSSQAIVPVGFFVESPQPTPIVDLDPAASLRLQPLATDWHSKIVAVCRS